MGIKIGDGGEVLIKGPRVMMGYYKNEAATKEVFTDDGFFRTGDIGEIDSDGYLKITCRIKELIERAEVQNLFAAEIAESTRHFARVEQIRKFRLLDCEWSQETDELTPTLKIKRRVINAKYAKEIESIYSREKE